MLLKLPSEEKIYWTKHSKVKMRQYRFSEKRVLRILRKPDRREEGIALGTIAAMQITGTKKHPTEAWMMYQIKKLKIKNQSTKQKVLCSAEPINMGSGEKLKIIRIISAWRYPGRTPLGERPLIPADTLESLADILKE